MTHEALQRELAKSVKPTTGHIETMKEWRTEKKERISSLLAAQRIKKQNPVHKLARARQITELSAEVRLLTVAIENL